MWFVLNTEWVRTLRKANSEENNGIVQPGWKMLGTMSDNSVAAAPRSPHAGSPGHQILSSQTNKGTLQKLLSGFCPLSTF